MAILKPDMLNDLAHDILNPMLVILGEIKRMQKAWSRFQEEMRKCPYAGKAGSRCQSSKKRDSTEP